MPLQTHHCIIKSTMHHFRVGLDHVVPHFSPLRGDHSRGHSPLFLSPSSVKLHDGDPEPPSTIDQVKLVLSLVGLDKEQKKTISLDKHGESWKISDQSTLEDSPMGSAAETWKNSLQEKTHQERYSMALHGLPVYVPQFQNCTIMLAWCSIVHVACSSGHVVVPRYRSKYALAMLQWYTCTMAIVPYSSTIQVWHTHVRTRVLECSSARVCNTRVQGVLQYCIPSGYYSYSSINTGRYLVPVWTYRYCNIEYTCVRTVPGTGTRVRTRVFNIIYLQ